MGEAVAAVAVAEAVAAVAVEEAVAAVAVGEAVGEAVAAVAVEEAVAAVAVEEAVAAVAVEEAAGADPSLPERAPRSARAIGCLCLRPAKHRSVRSTQSPRGLAHAASAAYLFNAPDIDLDTRSSDSTSLTPRR